MDLVGHPGTDSIQPGRFRGRVLHPQIVYFDFIFLRGGKDLLSALRQNYAPEHLVPVDDSLQRGLESFPVPIFHVDFGVAVTGNVAQLNPLGTADQVGLLKIGQREWLKAILQIRLNRGQTCVLLRGGLPLRRSQTQRELGSFLRGKLV
jgi:hypothetical protein